MTDRLDSELQWVFGFILALLLLSSLIGLVLHWRTQSAAGRQTVQNLNARIRAWWLMVAAVGAAVLIGPLGAIVLFALLSFIALREYLGISTTKRADHRALVYGFFVFLPVQYALVAYDWYGLFSILIPVYAFLLLPLVSVLRGDPDDFLSRSARIQWGLMVCVYCVSHVPALLILDLKHYAGENIKLLLFLLLVAQLSDVLQYVFGKLLGKHKLAPVISPNKTVEGFVGGSLAAAGIGAALYWITPFTPAQAFLMALIIVLMGTVGGLVMSAIKRDRGVKDFGALISGHGGVLDRIDSLCFSAPVFFHLTRYFFSV